MIVFIKNRIYAIILPVIIILNFNSEIHTQNNCGFDVLHADLVKDKQYLEQLKSDEKKLQQAIKSNNQVERMQPEIFTIPVVFQVL